MSICSGLRRPLVTHCDPSCRRVRLHCPPAELEAATNQNTPLLLGPRRCCASRTALIWSCPSRGAEWMSCFFNLCIHPWSTDVTLASPVEKSVLPHVGSHILSFFCPIFQIDAFRLRHNLVYSNCGMRSRDVVEKVTVWEGAFSLSSSFLVSRAFKCLIYKKESTLIFFLIHDCNS